MLRVVCWLWRDSSYRWNHLFLYGPGHVNRLYRAVSENLSIPHEFCCITDTPKGIDPGVRIIPLWDDLADMGGCYRRLKVFAPEMRNIIGERFVSLDLDSVVTGDLTPLFDRDEDFIAWEGSAPHTPYCGSMFMMNAGARKQVWEEFDPETSPKASNRFVGTDQAWFSHCLPHEARWSHRDGVMSFKSHIARGSPRLPGRARRTGQYGGLPDHARIVFFHGAVDPSQPSLQQSFPFIQRYWEQYA